MATNLFAYGTLRPSLYPFRKSSPARKATFTGQLKMYNLGSFPALVEDEGEHRIVGEVFEIPDPDGGGGLVYDGYEGYSPSGNGLYDRKEIEVTAEDGEIVRAWVYFQHKGSRYLSQAAVVPTGDWEDVVGKAALRRAREK